MVDLHSHADRLSVTIRTLPILPGGCWGLYMHHARAILLRADLGPVQRYSTLAHELGHAYHRHRCTNHRSELEADVYAARVLIAHDCWRHVTAAHDDLLTVAHELQVLPRLAEVYALHLARHPAIRQH